jgi:hypothetical protein
MEETNGVSQGQDQTPAPVVNSSTPSSQPTQSVADEKVFKQQEVNDIVGRAKHEAVESYKRRAELSNANTQAQPMHQQHLENLNTETVKRIAAEETQRLRNEWMQDAQRNAQEQDAQRIANEFLTKLDTGKGKYQDFDTVINNVEFASIPNVVALSNMVDNTADVIYELGKNPMKIAGLQQLMSISPKLALSEMQRLSQSIKDNETAGKVRMPNEPLSPLKPSVTGTDNGEMSVADYRKKYRG